MTQGLVNGAQPEVVVVGAGPVGLTTAISLGRRGVACTLIERNRSVGILPKMDLVNSRSMEIFARLGLADAIVSAGWPPDARFDVYVGPSLREEPYALLSYPSVNEYRKLIGESTDGTTPSQPYTSASQYTLEAMLRREVQATPGVQVLLGHELTGLKQDDETVQAEVRGPDGTESTLTPSYLVGCDGGSSFIRRALGIEYSGRRRVARNLLIFFRCPQLLDKAGLETFRHFYLAGDRHGTLVAQDDLQRWALHLQIGSETDVSEIDPADEVRAALGLDLDIEVLHCGAWTPHLLVADQYRSGRIFLAGDAAHQYIPTGGFGMNTGIGDADNLAWKLAAVLHGWGGQTLLDSYHQERHAVGMRNCRASEYAALGGTTWRSLYRPVVREDTAEGWEARRMLAAAANTYQRRSHEQLGTELGYRYTMSSVIAHEAEALSDPDSPTYVPSAAPGSRLPHAWIEPGVSIHDRIGTGGLTLIALERDASTGDAFSDAARRQGVPVDVLRIDRRPDLAELFGAPLLLVRPDLHVAWRGAETPSLGSVLRRCTGQPFA